MFSVSSPVAIKLNEKRSSKRWTYQQLATWLGVSRSRAHDWCTGRRDPNMRNTKLIAGKLRCEPGELI